MVGNHGVWVVALVAGPNALNLRQSFRQEELSGEVWEEEAAAEDLAIEVEAEVSEVGGEDSEADAVALAAIDPASEAIEVDMAATAVVTAEALEVTVVVEAAASEEEEEGLAGVTAATEAVVAAEDSAVERTIAAVDLGTYCISSSLHFLIFSPNCRGRGGGGIGFHGNGGFGGDAPPNGFGPPQAGPGGFGGPPPPGGMPGGGPGGFRGDLKRDAPGGYDDRDSKRPRY